LHATPATKEGGLMSVAFRKSKGWAVVTALGIFHGKLFNGQLFVVDASGQWMSLWSSSIFVMCDFLCEDIGCLVM